MAGILSVWLIILGPLDICHGHMGKKGITHLRYFGFAAVDGGWDDPHDGEVKTNYIDEVSGFTNIAQMTVRSPQESIADRLAVFRDAGVKAIVHIEPIIFDRVVDETSPSGTRLFLRADADVRWNQFLAINEGVLNSKYVAVMYVVDEPVWNGLSADALIVAVDGIKSSLPDLPTMMVEAYAVLDQVVVPSSLDWVGFDRYDSADPANDPNFLADLETVRASRARTNQKLVMVASTQWLPYYEWEGGLAPEDMADVAISYLEVAQSDPDVIALIGYLWPGGLDDPDQLGARNLPQTVQDVYVDIGTEILNNQSMASDSSIPHEGQIVFEDDFEDPEWTTAQWSAAGSFQFDSGRSGSGIRISSDGIQSVMLATEIPVTNLAGCLMALSVNVQGQGIAEPPLPWNGIKGMLRVTTRDGREHYPQVRGVTGDFGWINRGVLVHLPTDVKSLTLYLGLEAVSGAVWFDDVALWVARNQAFPLPSQSPRRVMRPAGTDRLRGAMVSPLVDRDSLQVLSREWQANVIRWQLGGSSYDVGLDSENFATALHDEMALLDRALPWCREFGLTVIMDLHNLGSGCFDSVALQDKLIAAWRSIATRYADESMIWAYDLVNEPDAMHGAFGEGVALWEPLAERLISEIQAIDPSKVFVVESPYGAPWTFETMRPLRNTDAAIVYSAHVYDPHAFTHQTLGFYDTEYMYPGEISGEYWDESRLRQELVPVKAFQDKYGVDIYIGEFSAIRWAPANSAFNYLQDALAIFETYEWDWCYHAFREWHGWSVEHSEDPNDFEPTLEPNPRQMLLRSYLERNVMPRRP